MQNSLCNILIVQLDPNFKNFLCKFVFYIPNAPYQTSSLTKSFKCCLLLVLLFQSVIADICKIKIAKDFCYWQNIERAIKTAGRRKYRAKSAGSIVHSFWSMIRLANRRTVGKATD